MIQLPKLSLILSGSLKYRQQMSVKRPSSSLADFKSLFSKSRNIAVITGAGISAESGIPTFRGPGGFWRQYQATELATPQAFRKNPSLVWEFYHYRRDLVLSKKPNAAHDALAKAQNELEVAGRKLTIITQNIDGLHKRAGSNGVIELHGNLFKLRCTGCGIVEENYDNPLTPALLGKGSPEVGASEAHLEIDQLPKCKSCGALLRPHVVWFGEALEASVLQETEASLDSCDLCLVIGTSSIVYPAAMFAPQVASRGVPVAEFNIEETPKTYEFGFHFSGPASQTVPQAIL